METAAKSLFSQRKAQLFIEDMEGIDSSKEEAPELFVGFPVCLFSWKGVYIGVEVLVDVFCFFFFRGRGGGHCKVPLRVP